MSSRADREIQHSKALSQRDPEAVWGWKSAAGCMRALRRAKFVERGAQLRPGIRVLEIGCGTGLFTELFAQSGASIVAVDISAELIEKAQARNMPKKNVHFIKKRFEDCDSDGPFDAVIGNSILHHLQVEQALSKIYELLRPGGVMSFAEPNMLNPQVFAERKLRALFPYVSPDETALVRWTFKRRLEETGFQNIEIVPFDWLHPAVPRPFIALVSAMGRTLERIPLLREFSGSLYLRAIRPLKE